MFNILTQPHEFKCPNSHNQIPPNLNFGSTGRDRPWGPGMRDSLIWLRSDEQLLGSEQDHTLKTKHELACVFRSQERYDDAEALFKDVLRSDTRGDNPDTLGTMYELAFVYYSKGQYNDAEELYNQVLQIRERKFGSNHPNTIVTKRNLALVYAAQDRNKEAEAILLSILPRSEELLGIVHANTQAIINGLVSLYKKLGRFDDAAQIRLRTHSG